MTDKELIVKWSATGLLNRAEDKPKLARLLEGFSKAFNGLELSNLQSTVNISFSTFIKAIQRGYNIQNYKKLILSIDSNESLQEAYELHNLTEDMIEEFINNYKQ